MVPKDDWLGNVTRIHSLKYGSVHLDGQL